MKTVEMRELTLDEIRDQIKTLHQELFESRFQKGTSQLEDTAIFRRKRHDIARLNTVLREKELAAPQGEKSHA